MKKFDKEYSTQFYQEVMFLKELGIAYSFVKIIDGVSTYLSLRENPVF